MHVRCPGYYRVAPSHLSQAGLDHEKEERKDGELSAAAFKRQLASLRDQCTSIDVDIEEYRVITHNLRRGTSRG